MAVREGLLALLHDGSRYGYQLKTEFESVTGGVWTINVGQVYTTLDRLERDGLVVLDDDDGQKSYTITASGREELGAWWHAVPGDEPPPRDELMLKVLLAIEGGRDHALAVITRQRTALLAALQRSRRQSRPDTDSTVNSTVNSTVASLADSLVIDALIVRAEADLRWLDICEQRVISNQRSTS